nr:uncharacterized protein LOC106686008 isoform X3 [Halyomorpha halys]
MDSVSLLPIEVAQKIFKFLNIKDLYQCMSVCKNWRRLINCYYVWGHFYNIYDIEPLFDEENYFTPRVMSPLCAYAVDLKRFLLSPSFNWKFRRSSSHYINLKYRQWKIFCHEPFIALLYPARNELHIFQCFPKSVECIDIIRLKLLLDSSDSILINKRGILNEISTITTHDRSGGVHYFVRK